MKHQLAFCILAFSLPCGALACSCVPPGTVQQEVVDSQRVFLGKVTFISSSPDGDGRSFSETVQDWLGRLWGAAPPPDGRRPHRQISFAVLETFKGTASLTARIATGMGDGDCGFPFQVGHTYVVYARKAAGKLLETGLCSLTGPAENPRSGLAILRSGR